MGFQVLSEKRFLSFAEQFLLSMPYKFYYLKQNIYIFFVATPTDCRPIEAAILHLGSVLLEPI